MAELTENLIKMGRELGYSGAELQTFVKEEKAEIRQREEKEREREEREKERESEREEKEREREREREEKEREREEKEREREERRLKREAEEQERQAQLQLAKINAEIEISRVNKSTTKNASHEFLSKVPKMAPFSESKGDTMDAFIFRFEMLVKSYDWSDDTKFLALSNLLTGDSLRVLQTLSLEQQNYNYLKQALLKKFLCTAADYNNKFRNAIPLPSEDADAFISRLEMVFDRWVELSEIEKGNYEQLRDLILRDQIYSSLHSDIVMFLKERSPKSVKEIRSLAEKYRTAHPSKPLAKDHSILANVGVSKTNGRKQDETKEQENRQSRRDKWHHQHIDGRRAQSCGPPRFRENAWTAPRQMHQWHHSPSQRGYRGNRRRNSYSYNSQRGFSRGPYRSYNDRNYTPANREYASSSSIMTSSPGSRKSGNLNLFPGSVNNIACSVLRDTGCSTVGIKSSFIKPEDYTGETTTCVMFDGSECTLPTAHAHIDTPFFKGNVIALVVSSPVADIILGNIIGINDSTANENNVGRHEREPDSSGEQKFVNVITRAQKKLDENINNRDTHTHSQLEKSHDSEINLDSLGKLDKHTFRIEQECDRSLDLLREKAAREDSYYFKGGLLYRQAKKDNGTDQLVVPCSLRELIMKCCHDIPIAGHMGIGATKKRVCSRFSWPGVMQDIIRFVKSCITCQKHCNKLPRLPVQQADIVDRPFDKVAIDIVGPLTVTDNKCRYILTLIDTATRYTTTGYPPFTLMYGRQVRGPADIIADICSGSDNIVEEYTFVHDYANQLHKDITKACEIAAENARTKLAEYRETRSSHTRYREFSKGDKVLILLPQNGNNLFMRYQGPYSIQKVANDNNYVCQIGKKLKTYHANLLKKFEERQPLPPHDTILPHAAVSFIKEDNDESESNIEFLRVSQKEFPSDVRIDDKLSPIQQNEVTDLLQGFSETLSDLPGRTRCIEHKIRVVDDTPFRIRQYPLPVHATDAVDTEVDNMLASGIIRRSSSPYASPITVVMKKDNTIRLCIDFRKLNSITVFDAEPIPTLEELLSKLKGAKYFTKCDLTKGYWQIPLAEDCKKYTAFQTSRGLMEFNYMPFGLSTAACTFQKAMIDTLGELDCVVSYFDDVLIFSKTWNEHMCHIKKVLKTLQDAGFTIKPSKTCVGCTEIDFLGHIIGENQIRPDPAKSEKIRNIKVPTTKKEVRSILGLLNYYRRFVKNFSSLAQPLIDLTKKTSPNKIEWTQECQIGLDRLKEALISEPILQVPDMSKPFVVQSDASNKALGAVLLQEHEGSLLPCFYASRRLLDREINYAIIEKETLGIVFALNKFSKYLLMRPFYIQTDHKPLSFLNKNKSRSARLTRWALSIQQYSFTVQHIRGVNNVVSDALSRIY